MDPQEIRASRMPKGRQDRSARALEQTVDAAPSGQVGHINRAPIACAHHAATTPAARNRQSATLGPPGRLAHRRGICRFWRQSFERSAPGPPLAAAWASQASAGVYVITPTLCAAAGLGGASSTSLSAAGRGGASCRHEHVQPENPRRRGLSGGPADPPAASLGRPYRAHRRRLRGSPPRARKRHHRVGRGPGDRHLGRRSRRPLWRNPGN